MAYSKYTGDSELLVNSLSKKMLDSEYPTDDQNLTPSVLAETQNTNWVNQSYGLGWLGVRDTEVQSRVRISLMMPDFRG